MRKLKLNLAGKEMLTKQQMKTISGGYGCRVSCVNAFGILEGTVPVDMCDNSSPHPLAVCAIAGIEANLQYSFCQC